MPRDKPYSQFKPGQTTLDRDYYKEATQEKPDGQKNLANFQRFRTDYSKGVSSSVQPGDYKVPCKDANNLSKCLLAQLRPAPSPCSPIRHDEQA